MDGVGFVLSGTAATPTANLDDELADLLAGTVPSSDAPAAKKELKIPISSAGKDSPSTAVNSKASPASFDVSSASGSRTPVQAAAKSRAKTPEVVTTQAKNQSDDESDADSLAGAAAAAKPRVSKDLELLSASGGARRAAPVAVPAFGDAVPESTPEVVSTPKRVAALGGAAASHKKAADLEVHSESGESSDPEAVPKTPARRADKANAPAAAKSRPKPPDPTASAAPKRIARPQASDAATEGAKAADAESKVSLLAMMDSAISDAEAPRRSVQSDQSSDAGESGEGSEGLHSKRPAAVSANASGKGDAKAAAKSGAKAGHRVTFGSVTTVTTPGSPAAKGSGDGGVSAAGKPAGLSQASLADLRRAYKAPIEATTRIPDDARSDGEDSFDGRPAVAPPAPRPGRGAGGSAGASSSSETFARKDKVAEQAALADEWNEVEARSKEFREKESVDKGKIKANEDVLSTPITFPEVTNWVNELPMDNNEILRKFMEDEVEFTQCGCFNRRRSAGSIPGLDRRCQRDKDRVFLVKSTDFDFNELNHFRMLRTAYCKLTRNKVCPMIGKHWEVLGFQHTDPRTDLNRSGRLLNVLHFFFFFTHHFDILKSAYLLAQDGVQNFPLACVCINLTQMVVNCLIEGKLSRLCNASDKDVLDTTCKVFAGSLFYFYMRWKTLKRTIRDTEATMKEVRSLLEKKPAKLLQGLAKGVEALKQQASATKFEFTDLDFSGRAPKAGSARQGPDVPKRLRSYTAQE